MKLPAGTHSLTGACPGCGEPVALSFSVRLARARTRTGWNETRVQIANMSAHRCADPDTLPLFDDERLPE